MAIYYYYGTGDWSQTSNWWLNANHTTPAGSLPTTTDSVIVLSNMNDTGGTLTVTSLSAKGNVYISANINADCYFYDNSYLVPNGVEGYDMYGYYYTYTAGGVINTDAYTSTNKYKVYFYDNSFCAGYIRSCTVYFYNNSYMSSGTPTTNINIGNVAGSFSSFNTSISAYFYNNSYNGGTLGHFGNGNLCHYLFYDNAYNNGIITSNNGPINIYINSYNFYLGDLQFLNNGPSKIIFGTQVFSKTLTISGNQNFYSVNNVGFDSTLKRYGNIYNTSNELITAFDFKDNSQNNYQTFNQQSISAAYFKFSDNAVNNVQLNNGDFYNNSYTTNNILNTCTLNSYVSSFFYKIPALTINILKLNFVSTDSVTVSGNFIFNTNLSKITNSNNQNIQIKFTDTIKLSGTTLGSSITSLFFNSASSINCYNNGISYYYNNTVNSNLTSNNLNYYYDNSINNSRSLCNIYRNYSIGNTTSITTLTSIYFDNSVHLGYAENAVFNDSSYNGSGGVVNNIIHNNLKQKGIYDSNILSIPSRKQYNINI